MYNIKELEENWKKYKRKQNRVYYVVAILIASIMGIYFAFDKSQFNFSKYLIFEKNKLDTKIKIKNKKIILNNPFVDLETNNIKEIDNKDKPNILENAIHSEPLVDIPILDNEVKPYPKKEKIHLNIIKTSNVNAYKDVENRFKQSHNVDDGLFLARIYYKHNNYKKSEYWSLEVNKLDPASEESLLIFVKSKVKLGHKNEALHILKKYIQQKDSENAKKLFYLINNNKFIK